MVCDGWAGPDVKQERTRADAFSAGGIARFLGSGVWGLMGGLPGWSRRRDTR